MIPFFYITERIYCSPMHLEKTACIKRVMDVYDAHTHHRPPLTAGSLAITRERDPAGLLCLTRDAAWGVFGLCHRERRESCICAAVSHASAASSSRFFPHTRA